MTEKKKRDNTAARMKRIAQQMKQLGVSEFTAGDISMKLTANALQPESKKRFDPDAMVFPSDKTIYDSIFESDEFAAWEMSGVVTSAVRGGR